MINKLCNEKGSISIILAILITGLFGFMSYVIDVGIIFTERVHLSNAVDAAALAGALELMSGETKAIETAKVYLEKNNSNINDVQIIIGDDGKSITIHGTKSVNHIFAKVIGINESNVHTDAKAIIGPVKSVTGGIRPIVVENKEYNYGELVTLKEDSGDGYHGNYGPVALGGTGASVLKQNMLYGYSGKINIGDKIKTETGNMTSVVSSLENYINTELSTYDNFDIKSRRIWTIPIVDSLMVDGRDEVTVVGFAQFFIEDIQNKAGNTEISGRFIKYVVNGEIDLLSIDTGTYGVKLID